MSTGASSNSYLLESNVCRSVHFHCRLEFGQHGKDVITIEELVKHEAGMLQLVSVDDQSSSTSITY